MARFGLIVLCLVLSTLGDRAAKGECPGDGTSCFGYTCCQIHNLIGDPCVAAEWTWAIQDATGRSMCEDYCAFYPEYPNEITCEEQQGSGLTAFTAPPIFPCAPGDVDSSECWKRVVLRHDGIQREYFSRVPDICTSTASCALIVCLHGLDGSAQHTAMLLDFDGWAEYKDHLAFLIPSGYRRSWNGQHCCGKALSDDVDDVGFLKSAIEALLDSTSLISKEAVFLAGFSNGAFMSTKLLFQARDIIAGMALVAGHVYDMDAIKRTEPLPVLIHWDQDDRAVNFHGCCQEEPDQCCCGISSYSPKCENRLSAPEIVRLWGERNRCRAVQVLAESDEHTHCVEGIDCIEPVTFCEYSGSENSHSVDTNLAQSRHTHPLRFLRAAACRLHGVPRVVQEADYWSNFVCECELGYVGSLCLTPLTAFQVLAILLLSALLWVALITFASVKMGVDVRSALIRVHALESWDYTVISQVDRND